MGFFGREKKLSLLDKFWADMGGYRTVNYSKRKEIAVYKNEDGTYVREVTLLRIVPDEKRRFGRLEVFNVDEEIFESDRKLRVERSYKNRVDLKRRKDYWEEIPGIQSSLSVDAPPEQQN